MFNMPLSQTKHPYLNMHKKCPGLFSIIGVYPEHGI